MPVRILIADDEELIRLGVRSLLAGTDLEIVASVGTGAEVLAKTAEVSPDLVLLDVRMPAGDGLDVLTRLREDFPKVAVVLFSCYRNPTYLARAWALGAKGYLSKEIGREQLVDALRTAATGQSLWTTTDDYLVWGSRRELPTLPVTLTAREIDVLRNLALGLSNKEIALSLDITLETVKEYVHKVLEKLHVNGRTEAAVWALRQGLVPLPEQVPTEMTPPATM